MFHLKLIFLATMLATGISFGADVEQISSSAKFRQAIAATPEVRDRLRAELGDELTEKVSVSAYMHLGAERRFMVVVTDDPDADDRLSALPAKGYRVTVTSSPSVEISPGRLYRSIATIRVQTVGKTVAIDVEVSGTPVSDSLNCFGQERFSTTLVCGSVTTFRT